MGIVHERRHFFPDGLLRGVNESATTKKSAWYKKTVCLHIYISQHQQVVKEKLSNTICCTAGPELFVSKMLYSTPLFELKCFTDS